ncbi:MAG: UDP-glucose dehydrogenase family protein [Candidatus Micrarchaeia archaeon]
MRISIMGSGYVGSVTGAALSKRGHSVSLCDVSKEKIDTILAGKAPIFEPGLEEVIASSLFLGRLSATTDIEKSILDSEVVMLCVGTPPKEDGSTDLAYILSAAKTIGSLLSKKEGYCLVVVKSTVPPGTTDLVSEAISQASGKKEGVDFGTAMNPEFLREGAALEDFENPDRLVLGVRSKKDEELMRQIYASFSCPFLICDPKTAEMAKYAANCMLATRISFVNELSNACKALGVDTFKVLEGLGLDHRVGRHVLNPGIGFGGSCLPKDVSSLLHTFSIAGQDPELLHAVVRVNQKQPKLFVESLKKNLGSLSQKFTVLGLSFKAGTDDVRDSPAIKVVELLIKEGAQIKAYDPKAMENAKKLLGDKIAYSDTLKGAVGFSDVVLVLSDWDEFKRPELYVGKKVFEGRKLFKHEKFDNFEGASW